MPELPEVETVRRGLSRLIVGRTVSAARAIDSPKSFPNSATDVGAFVIGASVRAVRRRAKVLMIDLSSDYTLVIHLKMTGQLVFVTEKEGLTPPLDDEMNSSSSPHPLKLGRRPRADAIASVAKVRYSGLPNFNSHLPSTASETRFGAGHPSDSLVGKLPDRSTRVVIEFSDGSHLYFNDQRKFGWVKLFPTIEVPEIDFMKRVGPEPLEAGFDGDILFERLQRRSRTSIKAAILDQSVLAGVGNIYADEALWAAQIHPSTKVGELDRSSIERLAEAIMAVLQLSIDKGGSTDRNYVDAEGKRGSYLDFAEVFRRQGQECRRCGGVIEKIRVAGRGTHICPVCQVQ